jgi:hypothetical protein
MLIFYASSEPDLASEDISLNGGIRVVVAGGNNNLSICLMHLHIYDSTRTRPFERSQNPRAVEGLSFELRSTRTICAKGGGEAGVTFEGLNQFAVCIRECHIVACYVYIIAEF